MPKYTRWEEIRKKRGFSRDEIAAIDAEVDHALVAMDLAEVRKVAGKTQAEVAEQAEMAQGDVSRLERRSDHLISTLRRYIEALGGRLEVTATFGKKRVRLHSAERA